MKKKIIYVFFIVLAALFIFVIKTFHTAGQFKEIKPHSNYLCKEIKGIPGGEDIELDRTRGLAYISSDDKRGNSGGGIYQYSIFTPVPELKNITGNLPFNFHPHGISIYPKDKEARMLFAVNHRNGFSVTTTGHFIEIFKISERGLKHVKSVSGGLLTSPNDVAAVDEKRFYVTNDHGAISAITRIFEDYLQLPLSNILYHDGNSFRKVAEGLNYGNGIALSRDKRTVYAASTLSGDIKVYRRNIENGDLKLVQEINLNTGVDNIDIDEEGKLWVGCHPKLLTFLEHSKNHDVISPSQVIKVKILSDGRYVSEEVYLDSGEELSASSVGVSFFKRLLIGPVFDYHILDCKEKR